MRSCGATVRGLVLAVWVGVAVSLTGCARLRAPTLQAGDEALDEINILDYSSADPARHQVRRLPRSAYKARWFFLAGTSPPRRLAPFDKVQPGLRSMLTPLTANQQVEVIITFRDTVRVPRFPRLAANTARTAGVNAPRTVQAAALVDSLASRRAVQYAADTSSLAATFGAQVLRTYWLVQAVLARMPLQQAINLAARPEVVYVRLNVGPTAPHHDGFRANDVDAARTRIGTDGLLGAGMGEGFMAILDTGVRTDHVLLWDGSAESRSHLCMVKDCVNDFGPVVTGDYPCSGFSSTGTTPGGGDRYSEGHGTSTAAILVGNGHDLPTVSGSGSWYRGVTDATLDCFDVYRKDQHLDPDAAFLGMQFAVARLDQVVLAEMQDTTTDLADLAALADHAYDSGTLVIATNGNEEVWGTGVPARGRRVFGVGEFQIASEHLPSGEAWGTTDGRVKPDLLAPSWTETAADLGANNIGPDNARMHSFGGTSGAAPYAAGAALLLENWMAAGGHEVDAGQVYAHLILAGDTAGPFAPTSHHGAGRMRLPQLGQSRYGKVWLSSATRYVDVPLDLDATPGVHRVAAAIWWPEETPRVGVVPEDTHNDIDLELVSPGILGTVAARSNGANGVFERVELDRPGGFTGQWKLRIRAYTMRTNEPQVVYWGASLLQAPGP